AAAGLADRHVLVVDVADLADRRVALDVDLADFARWHRHRGVATFARHHLHARAGAARDLAAAARPQLHVVDQRAQRDVLQRQRVARQDVDVVPRHDRRPHGEADRVQDVALLAVGIRQQRDPRRAVRVVLDRRHRRRDVALVALEVDDAVVPLVTAAAPPRGELAVVVAAAGALQRLDQRAVRLGGGDVVEGLDGLEPPARRRRLVLSNRDDSYAPSRNSGTFSPSRSLTYAFFQSARCPTNRPWRFIFPCAIEVRTASTLVPSSFSTARLMSTLVACGATSNTIVRPASRSSVVFSVISGRRMTSVCFIACLVPIAGFPAASRWRRAWR